MPDGSIPNATSITLNPTDSIEDLTNQLVHGANEEDIIASGLEDTMRVSFQEMLEMKSVYNLDNYRMAAYAIALKKIEKSYLELGI